MNVSLTPELERFVRAKIECGDYATASEVVRAALRLLIDEHEHRSWENLRRLRESKDGKKTKS